MLANAEVFLLVSRAIVVLQSEILANVNVLYC